MSGRFSVEGIFKMVDRITAPMRRIHAGIDRATRGITSATRAIDKAMSGATRALKTTSVVAGAAGLAGAAALHNILGPALAVEDAMAKMSTVTTAAHGSLQESLDATKNAAIDWSKKHVQSSEEFLQASYNMASAGLNSIQTLAGTEAALRLATATMGEGEVAGNLLATVYNNLGDKSRDASLEFNRLADVLAKTQALFQIADMNQLNESLKMGMPAAIQYGVTIEQLSNALGALNTAGLQGSMAGTAFSAAMRQMTKASKELGFAVKKTATGGVDFAGTLGNIEKKFGSFAEMTDNQKTAFQKAFGDEGLRAISLLLGKTDAFKTSLDAVTNSTGEAEAAQRKIEGTRSAALKILGNRIEAIKGNFAEALLPALDKLGPKIEGIVEGIGNWVDENHALIETRFGEFIEEAIPLVKAFAEGIRNGFSDLAPIVKSVAEPIIGLFGGSEGKTRVDTARDLGETVVKLGAAFFALSFAVKAVQGAIFLYNVVTKGAAAVSWAFSAGQAALAATTGPLGGMMLAAAGGVLAFVAAAGAAVASVLILMDQLEDLKAVTGGLGLTGTIGQMWEQGTLDPFKAVDEFQNQQARAAAKARPGGAGAVPAVPKAPAVPQLESRPNDVQLASMPFSSVETLTKQLESQGIGMGDMTHQLAELNMKLPNMMSMDPGQLPGLSPQDQALLSNLDQLQVTGPTQISLPPEFDASQLEDSMTITIENKTEDQRVTVTKPPNRTKKLKMKNTGDM